MSWNMFAYEYDRNGRKFFMHIGPEFYVRIHGLSEPIVPVIVTENPNGEYWGWFETGSSEPDYCVLWPSEGQFRMCFAYGPDAEAKAGRGRIARFDIVHAEKSD